MLIDNASSTSTDIIFLYHNMIGVQRMREKQRIKTRAEEESTMFWYDEKNMFYSVWKVYYFLIRQRNTRLV